MGYGFLNVILTHCTGKSKVDWKKLNEFGKSNFT